LFDIVIVKRFVRHNLERHYFICDYVQKNVYELKFVKIDHQWANILKESFSFIKENLNMIDVRAKVQHPEVVSNMMKIRSYKCIFRQKISLPT